MTALPIGVVPIFANAGAALLPAILAGLSTALTTILRPRELVRVCRERPRRPAALAAAVAILWAGSSWIAGIDTDRALSRSSGAMSGGTNWEEVALQILQARAQAARRSVVGAPPTIVKAGAPILYRTGPARRGWDGEPAPLDLTPWWSYDLEEYMFLSSPAVVGNRVFGGACLIDIDASYGIFFCLDIASGAPLWEVETVPDAAGEDLDLRGFFSSPAVTADGTRVLVGQGLHADANCDLLCFDAASGRLLWRVPTPLHLESSPAVSGDLVVVGAGAIETGDEHRVSGDPGFVLAVRVSDGEVLWRYPVVDPESSPVIVGDSVVIGSGFNGHALVALRTATDSSLAAAGLAREQWRVQTSHPMTGAVTAIGDLVLAGGGNGDYVHRAADPAGEIVAVGRDSGAVRWRRTDLDDSVLGAIAADSERAVCGLQGGAVLALSLDDGSTLWRRRLGRSTSVLAAPALTESCVYAVASDGTLAVLDALTGDILERHHINAPGRPGDKRLCVSSPTLAGGRLYVGTETGGLRCYAGRRLRR